MELFALKDQKVLKPQYKINVYVNNLIPKDCQICIFFVFSQINHFEMCLRCFCNNHNCTEFFRIEMNGNTDCRFCGHLEKTAPRLKSIIGT